MIFIEDTKVVGFEHAIHGMRNPMNSWERSDSGVSYDPDFISETFTIGENDLKLCESLAKNGPVHAKYRRMIVVYANITAPMYWWKEFDTYKVGTVRNSCSTMHKIHAKEFELNDFSHEHLFNNEEKTEGVSIDYLESVIRRLNYCRECFLDTNNKYFWWQMIQLLPSSYNQMATVMLNYEVLHNIYDSRKNHKLDEWRKFCEWIEGLPYAELITGGKETDILEKEI